MPDLRSAWRRGRRRLRRRLAYLRPLRPYVLGLLVLVVLGGLWVGYRGLRLRTELTRARDHVAAVESALRAGDEARARSELSALQRSTSRASDAVDDPVFRAYARLPIVRPSLQTARGLALASDDLAQDVLPAFVEALEVVAPRGRTLATTVDLAPFVAARAPLRRAAEGLASVRADVRRLPVDGVRQVEEARRQLVERLDDLAPVASGALAAAEVVPPMLGADGPRHYFLAVQNNAESRATGGITGSFGILQADKGRLRLIRVGANDELPPASIPATSISPEFARRYERLGATADWRNANLTPDFPTAGRIWTQLWQTGTGQRIDGVIAVDPVALSYLLEVTGPVQTGSVSLTSANVVEETLSGFYRRFPRSPGEEVRNTALRDATKAVFDRLERGGLPAQRLAERLGRAVVERHLQVFATDAALQRTLETTPVAGALPGGQSPYLEVVTQNVGGTKLDYYLRRAITYTATDTGLAVDTGAGPVPEQRGEIEIRLTNTAPANLPEYVTLRPDLPFGTPYPLGQNHLYISVYLADGATLESATLDGRPVELEAQQEKGHLVLSTTLIHERGATNVLRLVVFQPTRDGTSLRLRDQPLAVRDTLLLRPLP